MTSEEALNIADEILYVKTGRHLTDIQRLIIQKSLISKGYEEMKGYAVQHIKNEGKKLWELLSEALGEKVSKTNFRGALEKRLRSSKIAAKSPSPSIYDAKTWVGRESLINQLLSKLHEKTRLVWLTGISGVGKTALAECLSVKSQNPNVSFHRVSFDIEGQPQDFIAGAAEILAELGEKELTPQERNDPKRLNDHLLHKLQTNRYWVQLDAFERLLNPEQPTEFADPYWLRFFQQCLTSSDFPSRLVLTSQALPTALAEFSDNYPNVWYETTLRGLSGDDQKNEHIELFAKSGIITNESNNNILRRIGQIYEGHPLILRVIAGEIFKDFKGNVDLYWQRYGSEFDQVARELQTQRVNPALYNQELQKRVRQRVKASLKRLSTDALDLLCRSAVYHRPVTETFWLAMIGDRPTLEQQEAYRVLGDRTFIEREGVHQGYFLIRQHNLIRDIAYDLLITDLAVWESAERKAAELWLATYEPAPNVPNIDKVRGNLEAFHHYCELRDWEAANVILQQTGLQLQTWGYYLEMITLYSRLTGHLNAPDEVACKKGLGNAYLLLGQYPQAINHYQQSLDLAREIGDLQGQLKALNNLGNVYQSLSDYPKSINLYQQSLVIAREIGDQRGEGQALGNLGLVYNLLGEYREAINFHQQDLAIAREINDQWGEGSALGNLGITYAYLGKWRQAIEYHQQHLAIAREIGNRQGEVTALNSIGVDYNSIGEYGQAIEYHQQQLVITQEINDRRGEAIALGNLGVNYNSIGEYRRAIEYHQKHLEIAQEIGDQHGKGNALCNLGVSYNGIGEYKQAIEYYQEHLVIAREISDQRGEAIALGNLGSAYYALNNYTEAINLTTQKLTIASKINDQDTASNALCDLGAAFIKLERYEEALESLQEALKICQQTDNRSLKANALKNLAELYHKLGESDSQSETFAKRSLNYCDQALVIATELGIPLVEECLKLREKIEKSS